MPGWKKKGDQSARVKIGKFTVFPPVRGESGKRASLVSFVMRGGMRQVNMNEKGRGISRQKKGKREKLVSLHPQKSLIV